MTTTTPATTPDARAMPTIEALYAAGDSVKSGDEAAFEIILRGAAPGSDVSVRQLAATLLSRARSAPAEVEQESSPWPLYLPYISRASPVDLP